MIKSIGEKRQTCRRIQITYAAEPPLRRTQLPPLRYGLCRGFHPGHSGTGSESHLSVENLTAHLIPMIQIDSSDPPCGECVCVHMR